MKAELKQVCRGIEATAVAAAAAAEEFGEWHLAAVEFLGTARTELMSQCGRDENEGDYIRSLLGEGSKLGDHRMAYRHAATALIDKWFSEEN